DAVNLKVAEQYVGAFGNLAKQGNTLIMPGDLADMGSMVASAMTIVNRAGAREQVVRAAPAGNPRGA
ncbi:MAG TPA: band-7 C-terminal domain-containing protein, partial [Paraburkholderia sp.]